MKKQQSGFTLIEMVIVIILLGILAAVAVPTLTNVSAEARTGVQQGTLGALKSAWTIAYAIKKSAPSHAEVAAQMLDPSCAAGATGITCTGITLTDGTGSAVFGVTADPAAASLVANPSAMVIITGS